MKARFIGEGVEWNDPRFRKIADKPLNGAMIAVTPEYPTGVVRAKFYRAPSSHVIYCALWVGDRRGYGTAGGYGYHKHSAALDEAIGKAGIHLYGNPYGGEIPNESLEEYRGPQHIDGRGHGAMIAALEAIAKRLSGARKVHIIDI